MIRLPLYPTEPLAAVEREVPRTPDSGCTRCVLGERETLRNRCVSSPPEDTSVPGGVLIIGEGPGAEEDRIGRPFQGKSGDYLRSQVKKHWTGPVTYDNATRCMPPRDGKERMLPKAVAACRPYLAETLRRAKPSRVIALGSWAALGLLGRMVAPLSVRGGYGWLWCGGEPVPVYLVMHPAAALRNGTYARWFESDLADALRRPAPASPPWGAEFSIIETAADARLAARDLTAGGVPWVSVDAETFGRTGDPDFRAFTVAACARGSASPYVWPLEAMDDPGCVAALQVVLDSVDNVTQNGKYDKQALACEGVELPEHALDTRLIRRLVDPDALAALETQAELVGLGGHKEANAIEVDRAKKILLEWARDADGGPWPSSGKTVDDLMVEAALRQAEERQDEERDALRAAGLPVPQRRYKVTAPPRWWVARPEWWTEEVRRRLGYYRVDVHAQPTVDQKKRRKGAIQPPPGRGWWVCDKDGKPKFASGLDPRRYAYALVDRIVSLRYCALDALTTAQRGELCEWEMEREPRIRRVWDGAIRRASTAITRVESNGVLVSRAQLSAFSSILTRKLEDVHKRFVPYGINPSSADQVRDLLFRTLRLPVVDTTDTGLETTDRDSLEALRGQHPVVEDILQFRKLDKLKGTYADGMVDHIQTDGRIRTSFNIDGARSGRLSSSDPNLQTAPRPTGSDPGENYGLMFRDCFIAPDGYELVDGDFSQLELRVAAMLSGDKVMADLFRSGADFHMSVAKQVSRAVWRIEPAAVLDEHRSKIKAFVFGILYGMTDEGIMARTGCSKAEAAAIRQFVMGSFGVLDRWVKDSIRLAHRQGGAYTWWDGDSQFRFRPLPHLRDQDEARRKNAENASYNGPVQGTANEFCLASLVKLDAWIEQSRFPARIVLTVHDSILSECRSDLVPEYIAKKREIMEGWPSQGVPMVADFKTGKSWGSAKKWKPEEKAA